MENKTVIIYSVYHKEYWIPSDELYIPIQVGYESNILHNSKCICRDNTGENITNKNKSFCELTAVYWIWKNTKTDYVGLDHYRRHFCLSKKKNKKECILKKTEILSLLNPNIVFLPKKRHYWIETNYSQYVHAHNEIDLIKTRNVIKETQPEYLNTFDVVMGKRSGHRFNMMIMPWQIFDAYCMWLFPILFELEAQLDISTYTEKDKRVFGYISERLLDVYLQKNRIQTKELNYVFLDKENWIKKIAAFLKRKFLKK